MAHGLAVRRRVQPIRVEVLVALLGRSSPREGRHHPLGYGPLFFHPLMAKRFRYRLSPATPPYHCCVGLGRVA